jgi:hypothetical protein
MRSSLVVLAAFVVATVQAPSSVASPIPPIIVPAGDGFILSGAQAAGCDDVTYGYEIGAASNQTLASKPAASCPTSEFPRVAVPAQPSAQSLRIWLADTTCVSSLASAPTYYSDGTSTGTSPSVDHALLSGSGPYNVTMNDAGGACPGTVQNTNAIPSGPDMGNFQVNVTITTPPTVIVTAPTPSSGRRRSTHYRGRGAGQLDHRNEQRCLHGQRQRPHRVQRIGPGRRVDDGVGERVE